MPLLSLGKPTRLGAVVACALAIALGAGAPSPAFAERRQTDIILGKTAQDRGTGDADLPDMAAPEGIVVSKDGTVYYERDADKPVKIASITKVMTAIVALENAKLTDTVTVDHAAATVGESSAGLKEGDTMPLSTALLCLMVPSGNDAAMAIASSVGKIIDPGTSDAFATFIDAMNGKAKELGMTNSVFTNPHGLDFNGWEGDLHSTARDVATMFAHAMKNEEFRKVTLTGDTDVTVKSADGSERSVALKGHNKVLGQGGNIGGKTGGTYEALQCFVGAFTRDVGGEVYTVTLGSDGDEQRFADTMTLANWYYGHLAAVPVANTAVESGGKPIVGRTADTDWTDKTVDVTLADPAATFTVFSLAGPLKQDVRMDDASGTVSAGDDAGTLVYTQDGDKVAEAPLVYAHGQEAPSLFERVMIVLDRISRSITGKPTQAESSVLNEAPDPLDYDAAQ